MRLSSLLVCGCSVKTVAGQPSLLKDKEGKYAESVPRRAGHHTQGGWIGQEWGPRAVYRGMRGAGFLLIRRGGGAWFGYERRKQVVPFCLVKLLEHSLAAKYHFQTVWAMLGERNALFSTLISATLPRTKEKEGRFLSSGIK